MKIQKALITDIKSILQTARNKAFTAVNFAMVEAYWQIGKRIVLEEQNGNHRAEYGSHLIKELSKQLSGEFGKGFSIVNLKSFRKFYLTFIDSSKRQTLSAFLQEIDNQLIAKGQTLSALLKETEHKISASIRKELTWSHYQLIIRVENSNARYYYMNEAADNNWSVRTLNRNIKTFFYERLLSSKGKTSSTPELKDSEKQSPADFIKDPYIFEFLNIPRPNSGNESEIEAALIDNLKHFLLELGKGFSFVKRQFRISTETKHFSVDLVLYNYILKCFVLFDLKTGELNHQDVGQMDMYVRMFDDLQRNEDDNPTIGVILCTDKDETIVKYSVLHGSEQLFATKYRSYLPTEEELVAEIEREKIRIQEKLSSQN